MCVETLLPTVAELLVLMPFGRGIVPTLLGFYIFPDPKERVKKETET